MPLLVRAAGSVLLDGAEPRPRRPRGGGPRRRAAWRSSPRRARRWRGPARVVDDAVARGAVVYGVTTGFGNFADVVIPRDQLRELQLNLVRSHAAGVGEPLGEAETRALMLLRANVLAKGFSGRPRRRPSTCWSRCSTRGVHPVDARPRARWAPAATWLPSPTCAGPGRRRRLSCTDGRRCPRAEALRAAGLAPVVLEAKEGLALINGTQLMTARRRPGPGRGRAPRPRRRRGRGPDPRRAQGHRRGLRPAHPRARAPIPGQAASARNLRALLAGSAIRESHRDCGKVQDAYSLRCMPQVHGAARDALAYVDAATSRSR